MEERREVEGRQVVNMRAVERSMQTWSHTVHSIQAKQMIYLCTYSISYTQLNKVNRLHNLKNRIHLTLSFSNFFNMTLPNEMLSLSQLFPC